VRKEPNGEFALVAVPSVREQKAIARQDQRTATSPDDALIETYLKHKNITGYFEREARAVWALYKQLTNSKPLKDASRDDGRKLVDYYEKQDLKSASIQKKLGWMIAAVNLAIDEGKLKFNPFSSIVRDRDDKQRRLPLSETDIRNLKRNLDQLDEADQLLFRVLASTGCRLSEAFEIDGEIGWLPLYHCRSQNGSIASPCSASGRVAPVPPAQDRGAAVQGRTAWGNIQTPDAVLKGGGWY
jgi:hypothetical protein